MFYDDWHYPWQFYLGIKNGKLDFERHSHVKEYRWYKIVSKTEVALNSWTHVIMTWDHVKGTSLIYANGIEVGHRTYPPSDTFFFEPTGKAYRIGNDGHHKDHQFYGSVMDLYVFGTALSPDEISKLRGMCFRSFSDS